MLLKALRRPVPSTVKTRDRQRQVYRGAGSSDWFLTYGAQAGEPRRWRSQAVDELLRSGLVEPPDGYGYNDCLELARGA